MKERNYNSNGLRYMVYNNGTYHEIVDIDAFLSMETEVIKSVFDSHYYQNMYYAYLEKLIEDKLMSDADIETAKRGLLSIPYYDMLYTQEFLAMTLVERMTEDEFNVFKSDIEEKFIIMVSAYFGFGQ